MPELITANRLGDGIVVFFGPASRWVEEFALAAIYPDSAATAAALTEAKRSEALNEVVDPYPVELIMRGGHLAPKALREAIRANGPTMRVDLGKQAEGKGLSGKEGGHVSL